MPITRYQIRNEYSLADPELYLAANKDDPEALLEGVAMSGLVGVLRQLGDLSEFAAEIFHNLHEEVMVTAARGHSLTARVQQLEAEVPLIEKAILSQTNHSPLFQSSGVEWHPNLRMNQNMITQGDLPRFVMDSYEECRGPPRLFILDKFDIAGAGACLKRYTNPSFFKVEPASPGNVESQRDRRIRKVKKAARGRNGETPEILPTSNVKLHRLFLEDRAQNNDSEPARLVKLKKRHLQGSPYESKTGKSYMQKLFQSSPEHKFVRDIPIDPPSDSSISNSIESGPKILDIQTVSYATESQESITDRYVTPSAQEAVQNSSMDEMSEDVSDGENLHIAALGRDHEMDRMMSVLYKASNEKELAEDRKHTSESSVNESKLDIASETDNFMDALNSLESEINTDTESRRKNIVSLFNGNNHGTDSDANEEQNKNLSENGFLPYTKGTASSSDLSGLAGDESTDVAAVDRSFDKLCVGDEVLGDKSRQHTVANNSRCSEVAGVPTIQAEENNGECSKDASLVLSKRCFDADELGRGLLSTDTNGKSIKKIVPNVSAVSSLTAVFPTESNHTKLDDSVPNDCTDALLHMPSGSGMDEEKNGRPSGVNVVLYTDKNSSRSSLSGSSMHLISDSEPYDEDNCREKDGNDGLYYHSKESSAEKKFLSSNILDPLQRDVSHASTTHNFVEPTRVGDNSPSYSSSEQRTSQRAYNFHEHDNHQAESGVLHSEETTNIDGACVTKDFVDIHGSQSNGDKIDSKKAPSKISSRSPDNEIYDDQAYKEHLVNRNLQAHAEDRMIVPSVEVRNDHGSESSHLLLDIPCSSSRNSKDLQKSLSTSADSRQKIVEIHDSSPSKCHVESNDSSEVFSVQTEHETELDSHHPARISDISKTFGSVRTRPTSDLGYHSKKSVEGQAEQLDAGIPKFSFRHYEQMPNQDDIFQDSHSSSTMGSSLEVLPGQTSISNSSLQSTGVKPESSEKAMSTSLPFFPKHSLLPLASEVGIIEPPQLPPFPPMQWRVGKLPHEHSFDSFPPIPPPKDNENVQFDTSASTENNQPHNPLLQPSDTINESQYVTEHFVGPSPLSLPIPTTLNGENQNSSTLGDSGHSRNSFLSVPSSIERPQESSLAVEDETTYLTSNVLPSLPITTMYGEENRDTSTLVDSTINEENQNSSTLGDSGHSRNPFLSVPSSIARPQESSLAVEDERTYLASNVLPSLPITTTYVEENHDSSTLVDSDFSRNPFLSFSSSPERPQESSLAVEDERIYHTSNVLPLDPPVEIANTAEDKELEHLNFQSSREKVSNLMLFHPPLLVESLQPQLGLQVPEEIGNFNEDTTVKVPRPRNPLIDAVTAHGKNKLRKVAERTWLPIDKEVEERNTMLEQIRNTTFNLKPAVSVRPRIQVPQTNLKMAAILEKANKIRQATVGSDEDDDDNWSDD